MKELFGLFFRDQHTIYEEFLKLLGGRILMEQTKTLME